MLIYKYVVKEKRKNSDNIRLPETHPFNLLHIMSYLKT